MYKNLFSEMSLGKCVARNRIFLSPMGDHMANQDGSISDQYIEYYSNFAKNGVAVVTPGVVCVDYPGGKALVNTARMDDIRLIKPYHILADRVHRYGALLIPQIHHSGSQTSSVNTEGLAPVTSSVEMPQHVFIQTYRAAEQHRALTTEEVKALIQKFINTAVNCKAAECDGVSLHAAHGYMIGQFLSPDLNKRTDEYGGSFENRCRFAREIVEGIRAACGPNFIIGARIPGKEFVPTGLTDDEAVQVAIMFEEAGCDYLDVSYGAVEIPSRLMETSMYEEGNRVPVAARIKAAVKKAKVGAVGVLRTPAFCEQIIAEGKVDFVTMGRTLLADSEWPIKAFEGRDEEIRPCLNCLDGCMGRVALGLPVGCALNPMTGREYTKHTMPKPEVLKNILVIGGGIAGMQAAITAAKQGHTVTLAEASDKLGGQMNLACIPPHKYRIAKAEKWFEEEVKRQNVKIDMNCKVDLAYVKLLNPDFIIVATGAEPVKELPIEGCDLAVSSWDFIKDEVNMPEKKNVTVIGGGIVGCEIAEMLLEKENAVTVLEMLPAIATGLEGMHMGDLLMKFAIKQVNVQTGAVVKKIDETGVSYEQAGELKSVPADMVVLATGQKAVGRELVAELKEAGYKVRVVGDAIRPRKFIDATKEGFFAAIDA